MRENIDHTDPNTLRELYQQKGLSLTEIAELSEVGREGIRYQMKKNDIKRRDPDEKQGSEEDRFWSKVNKCGEDECWEWTGALSDTGYGVFIFESKLQGAHRVAYQLEYGDIEGPQVNHVCDNRSCVNPDHLYNGTQRENIEDAVERSDLDNYHHICGEKHPQAKLTVNDVNEIKSMLKEGKSQMSVADEFSVSHSTINEIANDKRWSWV